MKEKPEKIVFFLRSGWSKKKDRCEALREVYCRVEDCEFYKTNKEEIRR